MIYYNKVDVSENIDVNKAICMYVLKIFHLSEKT